MSASLGITRFPHNFKTQCPRTRLMSTLAPQAQLTTLSLFIQMLDIAISCMCATSPPTVVTPPSNLIGQASLCPHSPSTPRSGSKIHIQRAGTSVAPSSGSGHAARIACSCPVDVDAGANAVPFALCQISQSHHSALDSDILSCFSLSLSLSFFFCRPHSLRSEGKGRWYTLYNAVCTICRTPPLDKIACAKKIKSVGIRPRCVRVNHTPSTPFLCFKLIRNLDILFIYFILLAFFWGQRSTLHV